MKKKRKIAVKNIRIIKDTNNEFEDQSIHSGANSKPTPDSSPLGEIFRLDEHKYIHPLAPKYATTHI
jgi:hypothetical protein